MSDLQNIPRIRTIPPPKSREEKIQGKAGLLKSQQMGMNIDSCNRPVRGPSSPPRKKLSPSKK